MEQGYLNAIECIEEEPSAEPKRGKWMPCTKSGMIASELVLAQGGKWYGFKCSECGFIYKGNALTESAYCPNCGADMRMEDDQETQ
jgi:rubredoxin